jgi:hypothetical protein
MAFSRCSVCRSSATDGKLRGAVGMSSNGGGRGSSIQHRETHDYIELALVDHVKRKVQSSPVVGWITVINEKP